MKSCLHRGFTLIEVLMTVGILAVFSAGTLAVTWQINRYARDKLDYLAAENLCHDVFWMMYGLSYDQIMTKEGLKLRDCALPVITRRDKSGNIVSTRRLLRPTSSFMQPQWTINVKQTVATVDGVVQSNKTITVSLEWESHEGSGYDRRCKFEGVRYAGAERYMSGD